MKIAFVNQPGEETIPGIGGYSSISIVLYQIAIRLVNSGHDVISYGKKSPDRPAQEKDSNGILHVRVFTRQDDLIRKPFRLLERFGVLYSAKRPLFASNLQSPGYALQIAIDLKNRQPDVIHIHNFSQLAPIIRAFNPQAKIVLHMHCEWLTQLDQKMIEKRLRHVDLVIGCSEYITEKVRQHFPMYSNRCQTVYNGADLSRFSPQLDLESQKKSGQDLLFVGRVSPEKGVHVLIDAFGIVLKKYPNTRLKIAGGIGSAPVEFLVGISDGELVRNLARFYDGSFSKDDYYYNQLLTRLPADQMRRISFLGYVPYQKLQKVYQNADVFISASLSEALGMPILEALASGLPVIASDVGGIPELIKHGETGLLFQAGDHVDLAEAIISVIENDELRQHLQVKDFQEIEEKFSWETVTEDLLQKYQALIYA
jgi:glycosyltransferase involved in cell wall biosynthesis